MHKITVFGATGVLGKPVVEQLINSGFEVTAMVRSPEKADGVLPSQVKLLEGDLQSKAAIERSLENAEGIYLNLSVAQGSKQSDFQPERDGLKKILETAKTFNIRRIGYLSSIIRQYQGVNGFHWWVFDIKNMAIEMIKTSGIPYTLFYPSSFMENLDKGGYKNGNKMMLAGTSRFPMYFIAGSDYGKQVAKAFQLESAENSDYDVQGLEAFTADEAIKVFINNYQKENLSVSKVPFFVIKMAGLFNSKMKHGANILEALNNYEEKFTSEITWAELGKPTMTLAEYSRTSQ